MDTEQLLEKIPELPATEHHHEFIEGYPGELVPYTVLSLNCITFFVLRKIFYRILPKRTHLFICELLATLELCTDCAELGISVWTLFTLYKFEVLYLEVLYLEVFSKIWDIQLESKNHQFDHEPFSLPPPKWSDYSRSSTVLPVPSHHKLTPISWWAQWKLALVYRFTPFSITPFEPFHKVPVVEKWYRLI